MENQGKLQVSMSPEEISGKLDVKLEARDASPVVVSTNWEGWSLKLLLNGANSVLCD